MKNKRIKYFFFFTLLNGVFSCSPTKYVLKGEYLLDKNEIEFVKDTSLQSTGHGRVSADELMPILKQRPNKRVVFGLARFHLRVYSLSNEERIQKRRQINQNKADVKNLKIEETNKERIKKKKTPKQYKTVKTTFGEGLRTSGEAPVILDSLKIQKSVKQIGNKLINKGYFNNKVSYSVTFGKHHKAKVTYLVREGSPYVIRNINYHIKDSLLAMYVDSVSKESFLKIGDNFDTDKMDAERFRLNKYLLDNGYHFFNKEFIYFRIDSTIGNNKLDVGLGIQNYKAKDIYYDSVVEVPHKQYEIKKVIVIVDYSSKDDLEYVTQLYKKVTFEGVDFYHKNKLRYHLKLLRDAVLIKQGELYNKTMTEATYRKFSGLGIFKAVSIQFDTLNNGLLARIILQPIKAQTFNVSSDGLNNNGLYGIEGSMTYSHRNVFGGAERLQISFSGSLEAQKLLTQTDTTGGILSGANFNTVEFGPRVSLVFPRFLFLNKYFGSKANAKTELTTYYNYQKRPDFTRGIQDVSMTWVWHEKAPVTYKFTPLSLSAIKISKEQAFQDKIDALNDKFLAASYSNNIIAGGRFSFQYNGQQLNKSNKNVFYTSATVEGAGNMLRGLYKLSNQPINVVSNSYSLLGIRFAQFVKLTSDIRYYRVLSERTKVVYRLAGGVGIPLSNLTEALPFQKSFFSGGANGMRAWKSRTLGPGAYYDSTGSFDKIGDIQIESNFEFRFPLISWVEGAWFVDAGNIWLINEDSLRTGAKFDKSKFISEIAIGTGLGIRMDLDFLVIRFDFSMPFRNPSLPVTERWLFQGGGKGTSLINEINVNRNKFFKLQFNLGIGYPF